MPRPACWYLRHRRLVLLAWPMALVAAGGLDPAAGNDHQNRFARPGTQSRQAVDPLPSSCAGAGRREPALTHLLGRWNWWLRGLDRVLPHVSVEAPERPRPPAALPEPVGVSD